MHDVTRELCHKRRLLGDGGYSMHTAAQALSSAAELETDTSHASDPTVNRELERATN